MNVVECSFVKEFASFLEKIVQRDCSPAMLCPKLLDEVEKLKRWNIKVNSEAVQRDKQLQENKKTIESQRKAIQDLKVMSIFYICPSLL